MLFKEQPIIANDLLLYGTELWVATQDHGILIFKNGELTRQLIDKHGLEDRSIYKIQERDDQIYISHKSGFQIYSPITNDWKTIGRPEGIESGTSEDFALGHDNLWFAGNAKLLSLPINNIPDPTIDFRVQIDSILIGNQKVVISEEGAFDYKQNKLSVHLDFKGILFEEEAYYSYRLEGLDKNTKQIPATESEITYNYLPPGSYSFSVTAHYRDSKNDSLAYNFTIKKPYWQRWWFLTIIGIALSLVLLIIIFLRNKKMKRENEEWLEQQMLKTDLIESELKALRSQMNPHFVFNSLNSIQDLILQKDTDASYDYIVLFSNLVRNALSYSNEAFILLEKEIDFLETYLKLEKLRFGDNFSYTIDSNASKTIQVPSLIVQPFVENAIVHGLFHKQSERILSIYFELRDTLLICTIIDNGVGRTKALEIQQRQGTDHTSFALNSIHKRLQILKKKYDASIGFTITDLYDDETKTASGTKVEITLPYLN